MASDPKQELIVALEALKTERTAYFKALAMRIKKSPPPATEAAVKRLEAALGLALPPSYRTFLLTQNGFAEIDSEVDVLSAEEMIDVRAEREADLLKAVAAHSDDATVAHWIVFGLSRESVNCYLFDTRRSNAADEWRVIEFDKVEGIEKQHASFTDFLKSTTAEFVEVRHELSQSQDLNEIDF